MVKKEVQYPYAYDEENHLVCIDDVVRENRHDHSYHCPNCGHSMLPRLGDHNAHCFAHSENQKCGVESYIHSTAKLILSERFNNKETPLKIALSPQRRCRQYDTCPLVQQYDCKYSYKEETYNLTEYYGQAPEIEVDILETDGETHFRPDVLLRSSNLKRQDIFIEVFYKHRSSNKKIESGHRIIEIRIRSLEDLKALEVSECLKESEDVHFYNFVIPVTPERIAKDRVEYSRECGIELRADGLPPCKYTSKDILFYCRCQYCGADLVYRNGPYGPFFGCSDYPDCKYTFSIQWLDGEFLG